MAKALEVNDNSVDGKPAQPSPPTKADEKRDGNEIQGESLRVNENSVAEEKRD